MQCLVCESSAFWMSSLQFAARGRDTTKDTTRATAVVLDTVPRATELAATQATVVRATAVALAMAVALGASQAAPFVCLSFPTGSTQAFSKPFDLQLTFRYDRSELFQTFSRPDCGTSWKDAGDISFSCRCINFIKNVLDKNKFPNFCFLFLKKTKRKTKKAQQIVSSWSPVRWLHGRQTAEGVQAEQNVLPCCCHFLLFIHLYSFIFWDFLWKYIFKCVYAPMEPHTSREGCLLHGLSFLVTRQWPSPIWVSWCMDIGFSLSRQAPVTWLEWKIAAIPVCCSRLAMKLNNPCDSIDKFLEIPQKALFISPFNKTFLFKRKGSIPHYNADSPVRLRCRYTF